MDNSAALGMTMGILIVELVIAILMIAAMWKIFSKAGKPGWAALIPIYNIIVLVEVIRKPGWWAAVILLVPFVNFVFMIMATFELAKVFGKETGFAIGMLFLPFIFYPILAWGDAQYQADTPTPNAN